MHWEGLVIGLFSFAVIGLFHPIVIKGEYYFSSRIWPVFLIGGIVFFIISLFADHIILSSLLSVLAFTCFWSIGEIKEQENRVKKGWFPSNPKRENTIETNILPESKTVIGKKQR